MGKLTGKKSRRTLDLGMTVLMILVMSCQATGNLFHELAGVLLLLLFLCHNIMNRRWYRALLKGKYAGYRSMLTAVNLLTLVSMLAAMGTGIYLSQDIFAPLLGMREAYLIRPFHVAASSWGTVLVSVHGGMHIRLPFLGKAKAGAGKGSAGKSAAARVFEAAAILVLTAAGIISFLVLDMANRLMFRDTGMYWRYPGLLLFLANAALMAFFAMLGAFAAAAAAKGRRDRKIKRAESDGKEQIDL